MVGEIVIIGAGPAGLTAAYELAKREQQAIILEADDVVGGISRTIERNGWRFDIGGHRFFTKVPPVEALWQEILSEDDFPIRPRMSRIYYDKKFFDYPLRAGNALSNLGMVESARCVASYAWARVRAPADQSTFEGWTAARFGWRLYRTFFKTYTEKVWGVSATEIQADWAAQRIKNLSLGRAIVNAILPRRGSGKVTSLIEEFRYPRLGPGMMWDEARRHVEAAGSKVLTGNRVTTVHHEGGMATAVTAESEGARTQYRVTDLISSMPIGELVLAMDPPAPVSVRAAAASLGYRDFLTIALVVPEEDGFPDNWIYVHSPAVRLGRIQNFGRWSRDLVKAGRTCLGLEYFVFEDDDLWSRPDRELVKLGIAELAELGLVDPAHVEEGFVARMPKAYPTYDEGYEERVQMLRDWLDANVANVHPVGRNGMHRYNNQDHSMYTAMLTVENLFGASHDVWAVNVEAEYHEEHKSKGMDDRSQTRGTGRAAPILPARRVR